ncbi:hypothetical protein V6N11_035748 [Hibiscus sabdariffa]|uniref:RNase H type-1 domain-containing protein n=1 Tax=Hibiscus sabdariffa TaxID=183260 RepID=A0ABR2R8W8_9ROSI
MLSISLWIFLFVFCRLFSFSLGFGVVSISNVGIRCDPGFTVWLFWFDRSEALISGGRVGHGFKALCTQLSAVVFSAAPANALSGVFSSLSWLGLASLFGFSPESAYGGAWLPGLASGRPTPTSSILGTVFRLSSKLLESSCARIGPLSIRAGPTIRDLFGRPIGSSVLGDPFLVSLFGPDLECFFALGFPIQYPGLEQSSLRLGHLLWIQNDRPALLHLRQAELGLSQSGQWLLFGLALLALNFLYIGFSFLGDPLQVSPFEPALECIFALGFPIQYPGLEQSSFCLGHLLWALLHLCQAEVGPSHSGQLLLFGLALNFLLPGELSFSHTKPALSDGLFPTVINDTITMDEDTSTWLIGSVITPKAVDGEAITRIFRSVWKPKNITEITELRSNLFLIKPSSVGVTDTILKRQPWVLDDDLFAIESYNPEWRADDYTFRCLPIWVRVYKLPLQAMNGEMGLRLGSCIGRALGVDHRVEGGNKGDFLRVRVEIDIQKPLRRCVMLGNVHGRPASPCPLRYERLPTFCFFCGVIGYELSSCTVKPDGFDGKKLQYGSWLRVPDQQPRSKARRRLGVEYFSEASQPAPPTTSTTCKGKAASSSQAPPPTDDTVHPGRGTTTVTDTGTLNARHPGVASETNEAVNDQKKSVVLTEGTRDIESAVAPPTRTSKRTLQGTLFGSFLGFEPCFSTLSYPLGRSQLRPSSGPVFSPGVWSPPPSGTIAISVDGAFTPDHGAGIGVVARDSTGTVLGGLAQHSLGLSSSVSSETAAIHVGLQLADEHGWDCIVLESDCANVVNQLNSDLGWDLSPLGPALEPIRSLLAARPCFSIRFIFRDLNLVAHTLATWALHCTQSLFFDSVCPEIIQHYVNIDSSG